MSRKGIDVSSVQGRAFNWKLAAADGVSFAWCKAGGCTRNGELYEDPTYARNIAEAHREGIEAGAYWFFSPAHDPLKQADRFVAILNAYHDQALPPVIDFEVMHGVTDPQAAIARAVAFVERVEELTGRVCVVYTYPSFWLNSPHDPKSAGLGGATSEALGRRPLWIAHYRVNPSDGTVYALAAPSIPKPWRTLGEFAAWQTSGNKGPRIPGIPVDVDRNVADGDRIYALRTMPAIFTSYGPDLTEYIRPDPGTGACDWRPVTDAHVFLACFDESDPSCLKC